MVPGNYSVEQHELQPTKDLLLQTHLLTNMVLVVNKYAAARR